MTLTAACKSAIEISDGNLNGTHFSISSLTSYVSNMFRSPLAGGNRLIMTISLPDGEWYCYFVQYAPNEWDFVIPETREQEAKIKRILFAS